MIQEQVQILNELSKYLYSSIEVNFDFVKFEYKFNSEEEWDLISTYYTKSGKKFPPYNFSELTDKLKPLCEKLHDLMRIERFKQSLVMSRKVYMMIEQ